MERYNKVSLKNQKNLKAISRVGVGLDSLDLNYLKNIKVKVIKLKDELTNSVAELFLTLILVSLRQVIANINLMKKIYGNQLLAMISKKKKLVFWVMVKLEKIVSKVKTSRT